MIEWPICAIHHIQAQLMCIGGKWQYVCPECYKAPLRYSTTTEVEEKHGKTDN